MADAVTTDADAPKAGGSAQWRARIDRCKKVKKTEFLAEWDTSIDYRVNRPFEKEDTSTDRVAVPVDWSQTKQKQAQLFSQVPQVMLTPKHPALAAAVPVFAKVVNDELERSQVGVTMDECLPDVINHAGIAAAIVSYEARTELKVVPKFDTTMIPPEAAQMLMQDPNMVEQVEVPVSKRFPVTRISPRDLLWPVEFTGSNFDHSPWLGRSGRMTWAEAQLAFNLTDEDKEKVRGADDERRSDLRSNPIGHEISVETDVVEFDEVFYWAFRYDPQCTSFQKIRRIVFVKGKVDAVIDEDWTGQQATADGKYVGALKLPIRVLTLTYISDRAVPPSDSAMIRAQVDELMRSRSQMVEQRDCSKPLRWANTSRVDPQIMDAIQKGSWQGIIPVNGDGTNAIGEVARANYPHENYDFDRVYKEDIQNALGSGPNQAGAMASGERSASEAQIVQANFSTRIGYERARVGQFFIGIAEVLAGLVSLYGDFEMPIVGQDGAQRLAQWDRTALANEMVFSIRADSTVLLDANQRLQKLNQFLNLTGKSGFVQVEPILREMASLSGLDPDMVIQTPQPPKPEPPNVSFRFGGEDLRDPIALGIAMDSGYAPSPETLKAAIALLTSASVGAAPQPAPGAPAPAGPVGGPMPMEDEKPEWSMLSSINKRRDDGSV